jgi:hypothetical protein
MAAIEVVLIVNLLIGDGEVIQNIQRMPSIKACTDEARFELMAAAIIKYDDGHVIGAECQVRIPPAKQS